MIIINNLSTNTKYLRIKQKLTKGFLINIRNEQDLSLIRAIKINYLTIISVFVGVFFLCMVISFIAIRTFLAQWFDPQYIRQKQQHQVYLLHLKIDSLERVQNQRDIYLNSILSVLNNDKEAQKALTDKQKEESKTDTTINSTQILAQLAELAEEESGFRNDFEEKISSSSSSGKTILIQEPITSSKIIKPFNNKTNWGIEYTTKPKSEIKSVAAGRVLAINNGTKIIEIVVAHTDGYISIYKGDFKLQVKNNQSLKAGQVLANYDKESSFVFQLWKNHKAVNPENYYK